ncbi:MAG: peptidase M56, partial [Clostridia bacterium]|nr:peptidase M56 [Clostridia bacterium]
MTSLFETVFRMSLTASAVIAAVLLIRLALRKAPKKISYALWSVVGFRLLCPVSFRSAFSLFRLVPEKMTQIAPAEPAFSAPDLPAAKPVMAGTPIRYSAAADLATVARPAVIPGIGQTADLAETAAEQAVETAAGTDPLALFLTIGAAVWILGAVLLTIYAVYSCAAMRRRLRTATRLEGNVFQSDAIRSPFLFGIFAPRIYVPYGLEPDTLQFVLCHERVHLRRRDDLWKTLGFAALALHWFNPLVWLSFRLMTRDMEMSCDERVLADGGASARSYSLSLLSFAERRRFPSPVPLAFGESDVKARIRNILD